MVTKTIKSSTKFEKIESCSLYVSIPTTNNHDRKLFLCPPQK